MRKLQVVHPDQRPDLIRKMIADEGKRKIQSDLPGTEG